MEAFGKINTDIDNFNNATKRSGPATKRRKLNHYVSADVPRLQKMRTAGSFSGDLVVDHQEPNARVTRSQLSTEESSHDQPSHDQ
jgi:hypothetical protein